MTTQPRLLSLPQLGAVVAGNALEFYDFLIFGFFAVQIGAAVLSRQERDRQPAADPGHLRGWVSDPAAWRRVDRPVGRPDRPQAGHAVLFRTDGLLHRRSGPDPVLCQHRHRGADSGGALPPAAGLRAGRRSGTCHRFPAGGGADGTARPLCLASIATQYVAILVSGSGGLCLVQRVDAGASDRLGLAGRDVAGCFGGAVRIVGAAPVEETFVVPEEGTRERYTRARNGSSPCWACSCSPPIPSASMC